MDGHFQGANEDILEENSWSFGRTLPLALLLLPVLAMLQAYLENDVKTVEKKEKEDRNRSPYPTDLSSIHIGEAQQDAIPNPRNSTFCDIIRCNHRTSLYPVESCICSVSSSSVSSLPLPPHSTQSKSKSSWPQIPQHPYGTFTRYPWYRDHVLILLFQRLTVTAFALYLLNELSNFLGISALLRNRLFLIRILGVIPMASLLHLTVWYLAGWLVNKLDCEKWLKGHASDKEGGRGKETVVDTRNLHTWNRGGWKEVTTGLAVYWILRMGWIVGLVIFTFFVSIERDQVHKYT
jgi:hypothetical protein